MHIVRQLHDTIEVSSRVVTSDVEKRQLARMRTRNRVELLDALELAIERTFVGEGGAVNDFDGAARARGEVARQPDFSVRTSADALKQFMVWN